jgi:TrkA domain protein
MNVDETDLPGLGRRKDFMTASGRRIGVVELREGQTELIVSTWDDPDTCQASIPLTGMKQQPSATCWAGSTWP